MSKISPTKIFFALFTLALLLIFARFSSLFSFPESSIILEKGALVKVHSEEKAEQKFSSTKNGLSKIEILLRSPGIRKNDHVKMVLADKACQKTLRQGELKHSFLNSKNLYEFSFARISNSAKKNYCLIILPDKSNSKSIRIFTFSKEKNQPLSLRPVYRNQYFWQNLSELNQRISQYKPWFLKHYFLYFIGFSFLILSILLAVTLIIL